MDPNACKIEILHVEGCRCRLDESTIYVATPCTVIGHHVTKRRLGQLVHALRRAGK
jgi:hypothetical protein